MKLLADESVPGPVIRTLHQRGQDVMSIAKESPAAPDESVLARSVGEQRILLTYDKDFGELAVRYGLPASCGVILFRLNGLSRDADHARAVEAVISRDDWAGHFTVVTSDRIRMRPLP